MKPNESGRQPGDPSVELMTLIGRLQHKRPDDNAIERIGPAMWVEAHAFIAQHGNNFFASRKLADAGFQNVLFCGHWISPLEPLDG